MALIVGGNCDIHRVRSKFVRTKEKLIFKSDKLDQALKKKREGNFSFSWRNSKFIFKQKSDCAAATVKLFDDRLENDSHFSPSEILIIGSRTRE